jgi:hypothetical protein
MMARFTGEIVALITSPLVAFLIVRAKGLSGVKFYLLIAGSFILALGGGLLGLIIPAYLTTLTPKNA